MTQPSPAAIAAATWWGDKLGLALSNGTDNGMEAMLMIDLQARRGTDSPDTAAQFVAILAQKVQDEADRLNHLTMPVTLGVDYGPDPILGDSAQEAGARSCFPIKTVMWIHQDHVTASLGYHGQIRLVWASDEWLANRPVCTSQQYEEKQPYDPDYHGEPFACSLPVFHDEAEHRFDRAISLCRTCGADEKWLGRHRSDYWGKWHPFDGAPAGERVTAATP